MADDIRTRTAAAFPTATAQLAALSADRSELDAARAKLRGDAMAAFTRLAKRELGADADRLRKMAAKYRESVALADQHAAEAERRTAEIRATLLAGGDAEPAESALAAAQSKAAMHTRHAATLEPELPALRRELELRLSPLNARAVEGLVLPDVLAAHPTAPALIPELASGVLGATYLDGLMRG